MPGAQSTRPRGIIGPLGLDHVLIAASFAIGIAVAVLVIYFVSKGSSTTSTIASLMGRAYENRQNNRIPDAIEELTQALNLNPEHGTWENFTVSVRTATNS